jgi:hypothetical protein
VSVSLRRARSTRGAEAFGEDAIGEPLRHVVLARFETERAGNSAAAKGISSYSMPT